MKERILQAQNIGIWISPRATKSDVQIAHNLACGLRKLGKRVQIVSQAPLAEGKTFSVTLKGLASRVAKVAYEKDQEDLKLHFTLQEGELSSENVSLDVASPTNWSFNWGCNVQRRPCVSPVGFSRKNR